MIVTGRATGLTDTGRRRLRNEDAFVCDPPLFAVAAGMGGAQAGEVASRLAAAALGEGRSGRRGEEAVVELVRTANERIYRRALEDPAAAGMGTTMTVALADPDTGTIAIAHVGDSRAYRLRSRRLEQLTADHSLVAELVRSGRLTEEEALIHPQRSVITRALGTEPDVEIDTLVVAPEAGDLYLLCSDGLTTMLSDAEIQQVVAGSDGDPDEIAGSLVSAANSAGGEDNVTVVVFEMVEGPAPPAGEEPDETTMEAAASAPQAGESIEDAPPLAPVPVDEAVRRHGAGNGGRALALAAILLALLVAALLVWWGVR